MKFHPGTKFPGGIPILLSFPFASKAVLEDHIRPKEKQLFGDFPLDRFNDIS